MFAAGPIIVAEKKVESHAGWKLRRPTETAFTRIEAAAHRTICDFEERRIDRFSFTSSKSLSGELLTKCFRVFGNFGSLVLVRFRDRFQDAPNTRASIA